MQDSLENHLYQLEGRLLEPQLRRDRAEVQLLLADDFREFGGSGRTYDKRQILELLKHDSDDTRSEISQFQIQILAPDVVLATYHVRRTSDFEADEICSLRSSLWKFQDGRWQMTFHQGTLTQSD